MGQIQGREPTRSIWPPHHFNCGTRRQRLDMRTRNAKGIKRSLVTRTRICELDAVNFRSANFSSLNAHFRVADYSATPTISPALLVISACVPHTWIHGPISTEPG